MSISLITIFILILIAILAAFFRRRLKFSGSLRESFYFSLLSIKLPPEDSKSETNKKSHKEKISVAEQLLSNLADLKKPAVLEVAFANVGGEINFFLAVPKESAEFVKKQVEGFYPSAVISDVEDYNIFNPSGASAEVFLKQKENWFLPIKTYSEMEADSISPILNSFSRLKAEGEGMAIQIVIRPASKSYKKNLEDAIKKLREGSALKEVLGNNEWKKIADSLKSAAIGVFSGDGKSEEKEKNKPKTVEETALKLLEMKISKTLFRINFRILSSAADKKRSEEILNGMLTGFRQFDAPIKNGFKAVKSGSSKRLIFDFIFRNFNKKQEMILNSEELASIWHFPVAEETAPYARWVKTKEAPPPLDIPVEGVAVGLNYFRGEEKTIRMTKDDRRRHVYSIGQTGTGKTYLMTNLILEDIRNGEGVCVIDPHGDMIESILSYIPKERSEDVILFDPGDLEKPLGLNMLEYDFNRPEQKTFIINEIISIFDKLYDLKTTGGPMFEQYLRNALGLIMSDRSEPATLLDVQRVFTNDDFRQSKIDACPDPTIVEFWEKEAARITSGEISLQNITPYITSKFNIFISNDYMRPIVAQRRSAFNFREVMDSGKILLINLSKGRIGDINASLLGLICVGRLLIAALARGDQPENQRRDFYLYLDEFHNFTTPSIATILAEARKYRLNLYMAHQYIAQLEEKIRDAVFGNVGTMISFRIDAKDAEFLAKYFEPVFNQSDLMNIDNRHAVIKLLINNKVSRPFNIKVMQRPAGDLSLTPLIKDLSRLKYGQDRLEVEQEIRERYRN